MLTVVTVRQSFRVTAVQAEQAQQLREMGPAKRHDEILAGDQQVQARNVIPATGPRGDGLSVYLNIKAQRTRLNRLADRRDHRSGVLGQPARILLGPGLAPQRQREKLSFGVAFLVSGIGDWPQGFRGSDFINLPVILLLFDNKPQRSVELCDGQPVPPGHFTEQGHCQ